MWTRFASLTVAVLSAVSVTAADWADWRGPERNGVSREVGLVETWNYETRENILWESEIGGRSAPVVLDGRVYLNCRTHHDVTNKEQLVHAREQVVCFDAATGEIVWQDIFNVSQTDIPAPRVGWASMVGDPETGNVYLNSVGGIFRCYSRDGKVLWEKSLAEEYGKVSGYGGRTQTPIIDEDRVIVGFFGLSWGRHAVPPPKMTYFAFSKLTGDLLWIAPVGEAPLDTNYSNPIVAVIEGQRLLIGGGADGALHAVNARDGRHVWSYTISKRGLNATPTIDGHLVYISNGEDNVDSLAFGRVECIDARGSGDITKTNSVWRHNDIKAGYTALVVRDGILYVVADTGKLHAFDSQSGEELWEYSLGTVGKGSPTWADGKLYVMEVNGNIHILKPSREKCESLSRVSLKASNGEGMDEIYATPAISDGRVFFVTRDRTICVGNQTAGQRTKFDFPALEEADGGTEMASIRVVPYEQRVVNGGQVTFKVEALNKLGQTVKELDAELTAPDTAVGITVDGLTATVAEDAPSQGLELTVKSGELTAFTRLRTLGPLPWSWDFEGFAPRQVPPAWVNAFLKLQPEKIGAGTAMKRSPRGALASSIWLGHSEMKGYTLQADFMLREDKRKLPSTGLIVENYNFTLIGNTSKIELQTWAPHKRVEKNQKFAAKPDVWYTMKATVKHADDGAHVLGKIWEQGKPEPADWTIEMVDPHPNPPSSPGLYFYSLADVYVDNVSVIETE